MGDPRRPSGGPLEPLRGPLVGDRIRSRKPTSNSGTRVLVLIFFALPTPPFSELGLIWEIWLSVCLVATDSWNFRCVVVVFAPQTSLAPSRRRFLWFPSFVPATWTLLLLLTKCFGMPTNHFRPFLSLGADTRYIIR